MEVCVPIKYEPVDDKMELVKQLLEHKWTAATVKYQLTTWMEVKTKAEPIINHDMLLSSGVRIKHEPANGEFAKSCHNTKMLVQPEVAENELTDRCVADTSCPVLLIPTETESTCKSKLLESYLTSCNTKEGVARRAISETAKRKRSVNSFSPESVISKRCRQNSEVHYNDEPSETCLISAIATTLQTDRCVTDGSNIDDRQQLYECSICPFQTVWRSNFLRHEITHSDKRPFKCSLCPYSTTRKSYLQVHEMAHTDGKPYKCSLCSYATLWKANLKMHEKSHTDGKPYKCSLCSYATIWKGDLKKHETAHTAGKRYKCSICPFQTAWRGNFRTHEITHSNKNKRPFKCSLCSYSTTRKGYLRVHEMAHTDGKPYKCSLCSYETLWKAHLRMHEKSHTAGKQYKCSLCSYATIWKGDLKKHEKSHTAGKPYKCSLCSYATLQEGNLKKHEKSHTDGRYYSCSSCLYRTTRIGFLRMHQKTHSTKFPCKMPLNALKNMMPSCNTSNMYKDQQQQENIYNRENESGGPHCPSTTGCNDGVTDHTRIQSDNKRKKSSTYRENPGENRDVACSTEVRQAINNDNNTTTYECSLCQYKTTQKGNFNRHRMIHLEEAPFKCVLCPYSTTRKQYLQVHENSHVAETPYKCSKCEYTTAWKGNLKSHERTHNKVKPYKCTLCEYSTRWKGDFHKHEKGCQINMNL